MANASPFEEDEDNEEEPEKPKVQAMAWSSDVKLCQAMSSCEMGDGTLVLYSYGHLLVITGYKWDYTIYKWGYKYL